MLVFYSGCQIFINPVTKWPTLALIGQNGQKRPKMAKIQSYKSYKTGKFQTPSNPPKPIYS